MVYLVLSALLALGETQSLPQERPHDVVRAWLTALAKRDKGEARRLAALPLRIVGVQPQHQACRSLSFIVEDARTGAIDATLTADEQFPQFIECVMSDLASRDWFAPDLVGGVFTAKLRALRSAKHIDRRLRRYRNQIVVANGESLVEAKTEQNGVTLTVALILTSPASGAVRVRAMFSDFLFEE